LFSNPNKRLNKAPPTYCYANLPLRLSKRRAKLCDVINVGGNFAQKGIQFIIYGKSKRHFVIGCACLTDRKQPHPPTY